MSDIHHAAVLDHHLDTWSLPAIAPHVLARRNVIAAFFKGNYRVNRFAMPLFIDLLCQTGKDLPWRQVGIRRAVAQRYLIFRGQNVPKAWKKNKLDKKNKMLSVTGLVLVLIWCIIGGVGQFRPGGSESR